MLRVRRLQLRLLVSRLDQAQARKRWLGGHEQQQLFGLHRIQMLVARSNPGPGPELGGGGGSGAKPPPFLGWAPRMAPAGLFICTNEGGLLV